jgi:hypothetical protein
MQPVIRRADHRQIALALFENRYRSHKHLPEIQAEPAICPLSAVLKINDASSAASNRAGAAIYVSVFIDASS